MLTKLIKHEFTATGRFMWVIYAAMVLLSVAANVSVRLLDRVGNPVVRTMAGVLIGAWVLSLFVGAVAIFVLLIKRFHQNLLTDEGYLMFTLPGNVHQLVLSKLIVASVWYIVSILVLILSVMIAVVDNAMLQDFLGGFRQMFRDLTARFALNGIAVLVEFLVLVFVSVAGSCLMFYSAMSIGYGCVNHKALKSVLAYFVMWFVMEVIGVTGLIRVGNVWFGRDSFWNSLTGLQAVHTAMFISIGISLVVAAIFYAITTWNLKKRLNLS